MAFVCKQMAVSVFYTNDTNDVSDAMPCNQNLIA